MDLRTVNAKRKRYRSISVAHGDTELHETSSGIRKLENPLKPIHHRHNLRPGPVGFWPHRSHTKTAGWYFRLSINTDPTERLQTDT